MPISPILQPAPILQPIVALVLWSFVIWAWMYATRIPAIRAAKFEFRPERTKDEMNAVLPAAVRWKAENYNHLMEQPTLFYAVALTLAVTGAGDGLNATLAWGYVALRVLHSLIQVTVNHIMARWAVFVAGSLVLLALAVRAVGVVW